MSGTAEVFPAFLGTTRNPLHPPLNFEDLTTFRKISEKRGNRYVLLWLAKNRFFDEGRKLGLTYPADYHRTAKCHSVPISESVAVNYAMKHSRAFYSGVMQCGNVWTCPVCSAKIQERRRVEISQAMEWSYSNGKKCVMITFTFPHTAFDNLSEMLEKQSKAFNLLRAGKAWQKYKAKVGFVGLIRSLEITVGRNGWHPHTHELWIVSDKCNAEELKNVVCKRWESACIKTGLLTYEKIEDFRRRAVDIRDNATNSEYLAKFDSSKSWGVDREMAKSSSKVSSGCHPFDLLCECIENLPISKDKRSAMFIEYANAMHGKRQIYWSQGLKSLVGIVDKTDEQICEEKEETIVEITRIPNNRWSIVIRDIAQAEILYRAEIGGRAKVEEWFTLRGI